MLPGMRSAATLPKSRSTPDNAPVPTVRSVVFSLADQDSIERRYVALQVPAHLIRTALAVVTTGRVQIQGGDAAEAQLRAALLGTIPPVQ